MQLESFASDHLFLGVYGSMARRWKLFATITIFCVALFPVGLHAGKPNPADSPISMTCLADGTTATDSITCAVPQQVEFTGSGYNRIVDVYLDGTSLGLYDAKGGTFDFILDFSATVDIGTHTIAIYDVSPGGKTETFGNSASLTIN